ncbi:MAG: hypothetical protein KAI25_03950 [Hyphomicrobiaceae bacterium]|nr:hypothetical protein [Hyphomicrobiaceae bacterium]
MSQHDLFRAPPPRRMYDIDGARLRLVEDAARLMTKHRDSGRLMTYPNDTLTDTLTCLDEAERGLSASHPLRTLTAALRDCWGLPR